MGTKTSILVYCYTHLLQDDDVARDTFQGLRNEAAFMLVYTGVPAADTPLGRERKTCAEEREREKIICHNTHAHTHTNDSELYFHRGVIHHTHFFFPRPLCLGLRADASTTG